MTTASLRSPSPAFGIGYSLWLRGRWPFGAAWLLVLTLAIAVKVAPALSLPIVLSGGVKIGVPPAVFAATVVLLPMLALLDVLTYGPIDVSAKASPFPMHVRLLPLPTHALVAWPMLFAVVSVVSVWLALLALVLRPLGLTTSVVWPTTIVAACTMWAQAIAWIPLPLRFVRVPLLFGFAGIPLCLASVDPRTGDFYWPLVGMMVLWGATAFGVATFGLSRARTGSDGGGLRVAPARAAVARTPDAPPDLAPFRSAAAARRWYEIRRTTAFVVKTFAIVAAPHIAVCVVAATSPGTSWATRISPARLPFATILAGLFLAVGPILASVALGGYVGRFDFWRRPGMSAFFALRPTTSARMAVDKLVSAGVAAVTITAFALVVTGFAWWAYVSHAPPEALRIAARLGRTPAVDLVLLVLAYTFLVWRSLAVGLWTTMTGRAWPSRCFAALTATVVCSLPFTLAWLGTHPAASRAFFAFVPWALGIAVAAKLVSAGAIAAALRRRRLVTPPVLAAYALGWCGLVGIALAIAARFTVVTLPLGGLVVAFVPLARIGLAPLALDANRHR